MKKIISIFFLFTFVFSLAKAPLVHATDVTGYVQNVPQAPVGDKSIYGRNAHKNNKKIEGVVKKRKKIASDTLKVNEKKSETPQRKLGDKKPDYIYTSYLDTDQPIKTAINSMVQGVFYLAKLIYNMFDWLNGCIDKFNVIDVYSEKIFTNGKKIYLDLFNVNNPLIYVICLGILWLLMKAFFKGNFPQTIAMIVFILFFNIFYFSFGTKMLKQIDTQSTHIVTKIVKQVKVDGVSSTSEDPFDFMVLEPFKNMNFENEKQYGDENKNINDLLNSDNASGKVSDVRKASGSEYLRGHYFGQKFTVAFGALINNLVFSFVLLVFKIAVVFVKTLLLVLFTIAPFVAFVSFFEFCQLAMKNIVIKSFGLGVAGALLGSGSTLFITLNNILDSSFKGGGSNPLFLATMKIIIYVLLWKKRDFIFSIFSATSTKLGNNKVVRGMERAFGKTKEKGLAPVKRLASSGGYSVGKGIKTFDEKRGLTALRNHGNRKRLGKYEDNLNRLSGNTTDEKERKKALRSKKRFEKRVTKHEKKEENPHISNKKRNKLSQEKEINKKVLDSRTSQPKFEEGQKLKQLREQGNIISRVREGAKRFSQNTQGAYEKAPQRLSQEKQDKKVMSKVKSDAQKKKEKEAIVSRFVSRQKNNAREVRKKRFTQENNAYSTAPLPHKRGKIS